VAVFWPRAERAGCGSIHQGMAERIAFVTARDDEQVRDKTKPPSSYSEVKRRVRRVRNLTGAMLWYARLAFLIPVLRVVCRTLFSCQLQLGRHWSTRNGIGRDDTERNGAGRAGQSAPTWSVCMFTPRTKTTLLDQSRITQLDFLALNSSRFHSLLLIASPIHFAYRRVT